MEDVQLLIVDYFNQRFHDFTYLWSGSPEHEKKEKHEKILITERGKE